jgi:hypothetical protein
MGDLAVIKVHLVVVRSCHLYLFILGHIISCHFITLSGYFVIGQMMVFQCHVISCNFMSYHVKSCHVVSCHVMSCHVMSSHAMSCHVMSCHVMSRQIMSLHILSYHVISCVIGLFRPALNKVGRAGEGQGQIRRHRPLALLLGRRRKRGTAPQPFAQKGKPPPFSP